MNQRNLLAELKRRNVYKVAVAYAAVAWLLIQVATQTFPFFEIPNWAVRLIVLLLVIGFPVALVLAWAYELTPEGVKRADENGATATRPKRRGWVALAAVACALAAALFIVRTVRQPPQGAAAKSVASDKSIAVMPFGWLSDDQTNAYFAEGIQDEILTRLAKIEDLKVISRTSTQRYKSSPENLPEIARQLGVAHILEGTVQKAGDQVRVTVQLIEAARDAHLWAETYDRKLIDIFAVQSDIAEKIARSLRAKLSPREQQAVAARPTENPAAYDAYLRGLALWNKLSSAPQDLFATTAHYSRAVELDPDFAIAWAQLSVAHTFTFAEVERKPERAALAREALERARRLQPDQGDVHFADGMYRYRVLRDYDGALASFEKARAQAANRVVATEFSSYVKRRQGKWDDAIRLHEESLKLDPRNPVILSEAAVTYRALRRFNETNALLDRTAEIEPNNHLLLVQQTEAALAQGKAEAAAGFLKGVPIDAEQPRLLTVRFSYYMLQRQFGEAIKMIRGVLDSAPPPNFSPHYRARLAIAETLAGNTAVGQAELLRAREEILALRAQGDTSITIANSLILLAGFLKDKETLERESAQLRNEIEHDALNGPLLQASMAIAHAQLGEPGPALEILEELMRKPGALTPPLLADPRWDPLREHPRFQKLSAPNG